MRATGTVPVALFQPEPKEINQGVYPWRKGTLRLQPDDAIEVRQVLLSEKPPN
jgi:hypothetical protein